MYHVLECVTVSRPQVPLLRLRILNSLEPSILTSELFRILALLVITFDDLISVSAFTSGVLPSEDNLIQQCTNETCKEPELAIE